MPGVVRNPATDLLSHLRDWWTARKPDWKTVGAGVVIGDGLDVLTVAHVTDGAKAYRVQLATGEWRIACLVGQDLAADVALLRIIEGRAAKPIRPANLARVRIGQPVLALGEPAGYGHSVSAGIVSAIRQDNYFRTDQFIQIDALIMGGNSGGPVVDAKGRLLGLVSYGMRSGPQFIVPVDRALRVAGAMRACKALPTSSTARAP